MSDIGWLFSYFALSLDLCVPILESLLLSFDEQFRYNCFVAYAVRLFNDVRLPEHSETRYELEIIITRIDFTGFCYYLRFLWPGKRGALVYPYYYRLASKRSDTPERNRKLFDDWVHGVKVRYRQFCLLQKIANILLRFGFYPTTRTISQWRKDQYKRVDIQMWTTEIRVDVDKCKVVYDFDKFQSEPNHDESKFLLKLEKYLSFWDSRSQL